LLLQCELNYVKSTENTTDPVFRGLFQRELGVYHLNGPESLQNFEVSSGEIGQINGYLIKAFSLVNFLNYYYVCILILNNCILFYYFIYVIFKAAFQKAGELLLLLFFIYCISHYYIRLLCSTALSIVLHIYIYIFIIVLNGTMYCTQFITTINVVFTGITFI